MENYKETPTETEKDNVTKFNDIGMQNSTKDVEMIPQIVSKFVENEDLEAKFNYFNEISDILDEYKLNVKIEALTSKIFKTSFSEYLVNLFEEHTHFLQFIILIENVMQKCTNFDSVLIESDLFHMLFDIFTLTENNEEKQIVCKFLSTALSISSNIRKIIISTYDIEPFITYFNETNNNFALSILTFAARELTEDNVTEFTDKFILLKLPTFENTSYYCSIILRILELDKDDNSQKILHFVKPVIELSDPTKFGENIFLITKKLLQCKSKETKLSYFQVFDYKVIFAAYVNCQNENSLELFHMFFNSAYLILLEETAPLQFTARFSSRISEEESSFHVEHEFNITADEFLSFFFDDDVIGNLCKSLVEGNYSLKVSALNLLNSLLFANNPDFLRHVVCKEIPVFLINFLSNDEERKQMQTSVLQIYVLLLRKTPIDHYDALIEQITADESIFEELEEIGTDDSEYILNILRKNIS